VTARGRLPAAVIVAMVVHGAAALVVQAGLLVYSRDADAMRWLDLVVLCATAADAAAAVLLVAGAVELRRTAVGPRWLASVAVAGAVAAAVLDVGALVVTQVWWPSWAPAGADDLRALVAGYLWCRAPVMSVTVVAIAALGVGRRGARARELVAVLAALCLIRYPVPPMMASFTRDPAVGLAVSLLAVPAVIALVVVLGRRGVAPRGAGWAPAGPGLERVASALLAPIAILGLAVPLLGLALATRSSGLVMVVVLGVPAAGAVAAVVLIAGLLRASTADADGAPRFRLAAAAAVFAMTTALDAILIALAWRTGPDGAPVLDPALHRGATWAISLLGLGGVFVLLSALGAIAVRVRSSVGPADLAIAGGVLTAVVAGAAWITHASPGESNMLRGMLGVLVCVIGVSVSFAIARASRAVGAAAAEISGMPIAVARIREPGAG
jgi:hypothetical protein